MDTTLVVDLGSTSIKAAVVDPVGQLIPIGQRQAPPSYAPAGRHESDPLVFLTAVEELMEAALRVAPDLRAVAFSTQMHGALLTDEQDVPVSPFLSWQDERAAQPDSSGVSALERVGRSLPPHVLRSLGVPLRVGLGGFTLAAWFAEHPKPEAQRIHTLGSFILSRLTGVHATHITNAAPLGLVDLGRSAWCQDVVAALDLSGFSLPTIVGDFRPVAFSRFGGVDLEFYPDLGDHQASLLGSGLTEGDLAISLGTAGIAARIGSAPCGEPVEVRPFLAGTQLHVRSRLPGGKAAREFADQVTGTPTPADEAEFWRLASDAATLAEGDSAGTRAFFARYTDAYSLAIAELFRGDNRPRRLLLNGGAAQHIPWFRDAFARSLGLNQVVVPDGDLAIRGVADLLRTTTRELETRDHHARLPAR
ncbi:FGGY family carbohydrate kinase [Mycetocola sp. 2940]|uniref:FGGY family carbohydrate kinase n=1 Tax=Mycetocola sp. 2940 TaxID=3156452 RepID=UPI003396EB05